MLRPENGKHEQSDAIEAYVSSSDRAYEFSAVTAEVRSQPQLQLLTRGPFPSLSIRDRVVGFGAHSRFLVYPFLGSSDLTGRLDGTGRSQ